MFDFQRICGTAGFGLARPARKSLPRLYVFVTFDSGISSVLKKWLKNSRFEDIEAEMMKGNV